MVDRNIGYGTGQLEALKFLREGRIQQEDLALRKLQSANQSRLDEQRILREEQLAKQSELETQRLKREEATRKREQSILSSTFSRLGKNTYNDEATASNGLASTYRKLAQDLAPVNPKASQEYLTKATELEGKVLDSKKKSLDVTKLARQERANLLNDVTSQAEFDAVKMISQSMKLPIPKGLDKWDDPRTQAWIQSNRVFSKALTEADEAVINAAKAASTISMNQKKQEDIDADNKRADAALEAKRNNVKPGRAQTEKEMVTELEGLKGMKGLFSEADESQQLLAAQDLPKRAQEYMTVQGLPEAQAFAKARQDIINSFDDNGIFVTPPPLQKEGEKKPPQFVNGKIYTDANGNKARYNNGKWEALK